MPPMGDRRGNLTLLLLLNCALPCPWSLLVFYASSLAFLVQNNIEEGGGRFRMIQGEKPWPLLIDVPSLLLYNLSLYLWRNVLDVFCSNI